MSDDPANSLDSEQLAYFDELGADQVRLMIATAQLPTNMNPALRKWLAQKDQEASRIKEASQAEQIELARSAADAALDAAKYAKQANTMAAIALAIAAISIISTAVGIWINHQDAMHPASEQAAYPAKPK
jgi:uncharacterized membrane protein